MKVFILFFLFSTNCFAGLFIEPYGTYETSAYLLEDKVGGTTPEWSFIGTSVGGRVGTSFGGFFVAADCEYGKKSLEVISVIAPPITKKSGLVMNYSLVIGYHLPLSPVRIYGKVISSRFKDDIDGNYAGAGWAGGLALGVNPMFNLIIEYRSIVYVELDEVPILNRPILQGFMFGVSIPIFL
jgi:hypothetical protein